MLPQYHVKDPGHSAKRAGGRLQLNTHTPYICGFAGSDMVYCCMVYTRSCAETAVVRVAPAAMPALKYIIPVDIQKCAMKASHSCRITCERNESAQERRTAL